VIEIILIHFKHSLKKSYPEEMYHVLI